MKKLLYLYFYLFGLTPLIIGQERVTSFVDNMPFHLNYLASVDGKDYIIRFNKANDIVIEELLSQNETSFVGLDNLAWVSNYSNLAFFKNVLTFTNSSGNTAYAFLPKNEDQFKLDASLTRMLQWEYRNYENGIFKNGSGTFFFDGETAITTAIPSNYIPVKTTKDHVLCKVITNGKNKYLIQNVNETIPETLIDVTNKQSNFFIQNNKVYFLDNELNLAAYDITAKQRTITGIASEFDKNNNYVHIDGNNALIYQSSGDSTFLEWYDMTTKNKIWQTQFYLPGALYKDQINIVRGKILIRTQKGKMAIVEIAKPDNIQIIDINTSFGFTSWPVINDRYLFIAHKNNINIVDLDNGNLTSTQYGTESSAVFDITVVKKNDDNFISILFKNKSINTIFVFDKNTKTLLPHSLINPKVGLPYYSKIFGFNDEIILASKNIYNITSDTLLVNLSPINATQFKQSDIGFHYTSTVDDKTVHYSYDGKKLVENGSISGTKFPYFEETSDAVFLVDNLYNLSRIEKSTNVTKAIADKVYGFSLLNLFPVFNDEFYYSKDNYNMFKVNPIGTKIDLNTKNGDNFFDSYVINNDRLYFLGYDKVQMIDGNGTTGTLIELGEKVNINMSMYRCGSNVLVHHNDYNSDNFYVIDANNNVNKIVAAQNWIRSSANDNFTFFSHNDSTLLFDHLKGVFYQMPNSFKHSQMVSIFTSVKGTFALFNSNGILQTFRCNANFTQIELVNELALGYAYQGKAHTYPEGTLLIGKKDLIFIDNTGKAKTITGLQGFDKMDLNAIRKGKDIYIMGIDIKWGRQVFKLNLDELTAVEQVHEIVHLNAYPNPTSGELNVELKGPYDVTIIDHLGRNVKLQMKILNNKIDASMIPNGLYNMIIVQDHKTYTSRFIKSN